MGWSRFAAVGQLLRIATLVRLQAETLDELQDARLKFENLEFYDVGTAITRPLLAGFPQNFGDLRPPKFHADDKRFDEGHAPIDDQTSAISRKFRPHAMKRLRDRGHTDRQTLHVLLDRSGGFQPEHGVGSGDSVRSATRTVDHEWLIKCMKFRSDKSDPSGWKAPDSTAVETPVHGLHDDIVGPAGRCGSEISRAAS
jgi:alpha-ketoglutarate-dependent taurine dioxygenase